MFSVKSAVTQKQYRTIGRNFVCALLAIVSVQSVNASEIPDFAAIKDVREKKAAFFDYFYPLVLEQNRQVLKERTAIKSADTSAAELDRLCDKYLRDCVKYDASRQKELLDRVDFIPPSLALAQSANESAWGTSRFALQASNYFGQWCFTKGCGMVPLRRAPGAVHEVRTFSSPEASVRSYIMNLNTGGAFEHLRKVRAQYRLETINFTGYDLAIGLNKYSERGDEYVREIRQMIDYNKLVRRYDDKFWKALDNNKKSN
ncbi:Uncharacterised protein [BD1-7 clade bacterium]|uniref:Mannosyl-glycoprotein endo-beta-N-acetylglucosamidase-like domain-containing protein n=1 Tax=BD1-7 clade bacterium TaxID=2029982 RepID=A0A5S9QVM9_9GAMM|nr:Uncharacterised protein [BD1-7 clade bacterium]CAA0122636.1 Uncharacterised protein [BD1-7 clade bacterium]